jgi:inhibitor of KinA
MITVIPYGENALLVNFEQQISQEVHTQVVALRNALRDNEGITYMVPSYCALTVVYDRSVVAFHELKKQIVGSVETLDTSAQSVHGRLIRIPVCYDENYALDHDEVCAQTGKKWQEVISTHLDTEFYVYMLGFIPGFAYLGDMPKGYFCKRKQDPRTSVPAGSVGLSGLQSAIYPYASPGGWQIIGRTPLQLFDPASETPNLLNPGDRVRFESVDADVFKKNKI